MGSTVFFNLGFFFQFIVNAALKMFKLRLLDAAPDMFNLRLIKRNSISV